MSLARTPPSAGLSASESDLRNLSSMQDGIDSITQRDKRRRLPDDEEDHLTSFKIEMKEMLQTFLLQQNTRMDALERKMADVKTDTSLISATNVQIDHSIATVSNQLTSMQTKITELEGDCKVLANQVNSIEEKITKDRQEQSTEMTQIYQKVEDIQQYSRSSSVEIGNVPEPHGKETTNDLISIVLSIVKSLKVDIETRDVRDVYRSHGKPGTIRQIVVEFTSVSLKSKLLSAIRSFNKGKEIINKFNSEVVGLPTEKNPIYINEHLCFGTKRLLYRTREFAKQNDYKYSWIRDGKIHLRKSDGEKYIIVKSEKCLENLKTKL